MLTGYLPPTSGTATIAGFDIVKNPLEARKHLGYLPEHVPLYDDQRVTEYLKFQAPGLKAFLPSRSGLPSPRL